MNRRDGFMPIVFASVQSVHKRAHQLGRFDLIIIDECHLVPNRGNTMYRRCCRPS
jgi:DNA repair protein RadD